MFFYEIITKFLLLYPVKVIFGLKFSPVKSLEIIHFSIVTYFSYQKRWRIRLFVLSLQLLNSCNALQYHAVHYKKRRKPV